MSTGHLCSTALLVELSMATPLTLLGNQVLGDCYFGSETRHKSGYYFSLLLNLEKKALISFAVGRGGGVVRGDKPNLKINWIFFLIHR